MGVRVKMDGDWPDFEKKLDEFLDKKIAEAETVARSYVGPLKDHIHKDTGALSASVDYDSHRTKDMWTAALSVGGEGVKYSIFENSRRGHSVFGDVDEKLTKDMSAVWQAKPKKTGSVDHSKREATE